MRRDSRRRASQDGTQRAQRDGDGGEEREHASDASFEAMSWPVAQRTPVADLTPEDMVVVAVVLACAGGPAERGLAPASDGWHRAKQVMLEAALNSILKQAGLKS